MILNFLNTEKTGTLKQRIITNDDTLGCYIRNPYSNTIAQPKKSFLSELIEKYIS